MPDKFGQSTGSLDRRVKYANEAKGMTDREISEFAFIELRDLSHHVRVEINGKVKTLWGVWQWCLGAGKILAFLGMVVGLIIGASKLL